MLAKLMNSLDLPLHDKKSTYFHNYIHFERRPNTKLKRGYDRTTQYIIVHLSHVIANGNSYWFSIQSNTPFNGDKNCTSYI